MPSYGSNTSSSIWSWIIKSLKEIFNTFINSSVSWVSPKVEVIVGVSSDKTVGPISQFYARSYHLSLHVARISIWILLILRLFTDTARNYMCFFNWLRYKTLGYSKGHQSPNSWSAARTKNIFSTNLGNSHICTYSSLFKIKTVVQQIKSYFRVYLFIPDCDTHICPQPRLALLDWTYCMQRYSRLNIFIVDYVNFSRFLSIQQ